MGEYKAVLFDAGGTLWYSEPPESVWQKIHVDLGLHVPPVRVQEAWAKALNQLMPRFLAFESSGHLNGLLSIDNLFAASEVDVVEELGVVVDRKELRTLAKERFASGPTLYAETSDVLRKLRTMGFLIATVSNGVYQEMVSRKLGVHIYCDSIIGSVHVGFAKPDPEIFHLALEVLNVRPQEAIMIGDNWGADVLGASSVGIRGIHLARGDDESPVSDFITDLREVIDIVV